MLFFFLYLFVFFFFNDTATTEIYTLSLHDALPIYPPVVVSVDPSVVVVSSPDELQPAPMSARTATAARANLHLWSGRLDSVGIYFSLSRIHITVIDYNAQMQSITLWSRNEENYVIRG